MDNKYSLRPLTENDAGSLARQLNNKKVWDNLRNGLPYPYTIEDAKAFIELQNNQPSLTCYGIVVAGNVVGNIGFTRCQDIERFTAEVGYYIGEDYWGQNIMSAALNEAVDDVFNKTDIIRIFATLFDFNKASAKVLEKADFTLKCTLTKGAYKNGRFVDMLYYERIKQTAYNEKEKINFRITQITNNKKQFLDLLLLADEKEFMIDRYLERGEMFVLYEDEVKSVCVVTDEGNGTCELKNIAVKIDSQRKGYGKKLIEYLVAHYAGVYRQMIVGTGDVPGTVNFYTNCGFEYSHRIENFFIDNYEHQMNEDGVILKDMIYFKQKI